MKHPSQWKEAATIEFSGLEASELIQTKLSEMSKSMPESVEEWQEFYADLDAIQQIAEKIIIKLSN